MSVTTAYFSVVNLFCVATISLLQLIIHSQPYRRKYLYYCVRWPRPKTNERPHAEPWLLLLLFNLKMSEGAALQMPAWNQIGMGTQFSWRQVVLQEGTTLIQHVFILLEPKSHGVQASFKGKMASFKQWNFYNHPDVWVDVRI